MTEIYPSSFFFYLRLELECWVFYLENLYIYMVMIIFNAVWAFTSEINCVCVCVCLSLSTGPVRLQDHLVRTGFHAPPAGG